MNKNTDIILNFIIIIGIIIIWSLVANLVSSTDTNADDELVKLIRLILFDFTVHITEINFLIPLIPNSLSIIVTLGGIKIRRNYQNN